MFFFADMKFIVSSCIFGFYKMTMDVLRSISDVRFFVPYYILILIMDAYHYVIDT